MMLFVKYHNIIILAPYFLPSYWHIGPSFPPYENKRLISVYYGDELQYVGPASKTEDTKY
jgi:hypothetical protein